MTELLAPAGNWDCARAAVANGADAIFFGLPKFNARMRADNFTNDDLPELMAYLHRHGVKGFVAFNTLVFPSELPGAVEQIEVMARAGVDAVIVQDLGVAQLVNEIAPQMELHASTQMTLTSPQGLAFVERFLKMERAVLARELSIEDIKRIASSSEVPIECFVHGALCVAYSGQCLTSESLGQRSANRGECAQACRMPYEVVVDGVTKPMGEVRYLLSPQDLAAVDLIPEMVKAGVVSFKIEGRLKSPDYVAAVTRVYRKALDEVEVTEHDRYTLEMMFSRGLTSGWLEGSNHPRLTHGRWGKKRGVAGGMITRVGHNWIEIDNQNGVVFQKGDGVVLDAGEERNSEQGGSLWEVKGSRLTFDRRANIDWARVRVGQQVFKTRDPELDREVRKTWKGVRIVEKGEGLEIAASGKAGEPLVLETRGQSVQSEIVLQKAESRALTPEVLEGQLARLGGTGFQLKAVNYQLEEGVMLPLGEINRTRRKLLQKLETKPTVHDGQAILRRLQGELAAGGAEEQTCNLAVLTRTFPQLEGALQAGMKTVYCDFEDLRDYKKCVEMAQEAGAAVFLATPRIQKPRETGFFKMVEKAAPDGVLVRNLGGVDYFRENPAMRLRADFSLNIANPLTAKLLKEHGGFELLTASYDLNESQLCDLLDGVPRDWMEVTLHQHMPMFHMEHCVFCTFLSDGGTNVSNCGKPCEKHDVRLRDRVGQQHYLRADVGCRNTLFNGRAQTGAASLDNLRHHGLQNVRIELLTENRKQAIRTIRLYQDLIAGKIFPTELAHYLGATTRIGVTKGTLEQKRDEVHA